MDHGTKKQNNRPNNMPNDLESLVKKYIKITDYYQTKYTYHINLDLKSLFEVFFFLFTRTIIYYTI